MTDDAAQARWKRPGLARPDGTGRRLAWALVLCGVGAAGAAAAQTGYVGILGGGPVYKGVAGNVGELKTSGFNELIVCSVEVGSIGDLNLNAEFPLTSSGAYVGDQTYPHFPADLGEDQAG